MLAVLPGKIRSPANDQQRIKDQPALHFTSPTNLRTRADSAQSFPRPNLTKRLAILLKVRHGEVVDLVLLQERIRLHVGFETKQPAKLSGRNGAGPVCFERQAFKRRARQIRPLRFQSCAMSSGSSNVISMALQSLSQGTARSPHARFRSRHETLFAPNASDTAPTDDLKGCRFRGEPVSHAEAFRGAGLVFATVGIFTRSSLP